MPLPVPQTPPPIVTPPAPNIEGGYGYKPSPEESSRVTNFLQSYDMGKPLQSVVLVPSKAWPKVLTDMRVPVLAGGIKTQKAFTLVAPGANRVYLNTDGFLEKSPESGIGKGKVGGASSPDSRQDFSRRRSTMGHPRIGHLEFPALANRPVGAHTRGSCPKPSCA